MGISEKFGLSFGPTWDIWCTGEDIECILDRITSPEVELPSGVICMNTVPGGVPVNQIFLRGGYLEFIWSDGMVSHITFADFLSNLKRWADVYYNDIFIDEDGRLTVTSLLYRDLELILQYQLK